MFNGLGFRMIYTVAPRKSILMLIVQFRATSDPRQAVLGPKSQEVP